MAEQTVTAQDGTVRRVVAVDDKDLKDAVKSVEDQTVTPAFDINVPVRKGHDLLNPVVGANEAALDGTGAHNSPRDAVRDDGSVEGSEPLFVRPSVVPAQTEVKELVSDGELKDVTAEDVANSQNAVDKAVAESTENTDTSAKPTKADTQTA